MSEDGALRVLLVDPSLFTAPYDAALTQGLLEAGVTPTWAVRPTREQDRSELPPEHTEPLFYGWIERQPLPPKLRTVGKGLAHAWGLAKLLKRVVQLKPDVVHFQWVVVPPLDSLAMAAVGLFCPLVLTVHDTVPFNGDRMSLLQKWGFDVPLRLSDHVIVHTRRGKETLVKRGFSEDKVSIIPHGALPLHEAPSADALSVKKDGRYRFVLFGELKPYKGIDVLIEALALVPLETRAKLHVTVAGRPRMELGPLLERAAELGLGEVLEVRPQRLSDAEMADLFAQADCFLFPYRQIDASGVYFLTKSLGKWLIASSVGIFEEELRGTQQGELVPADDARALADAITAATESRRIPAPAPAGTDWTAIGLATTELYRSTQADRFRQRAVPAGRLGASG